MPQTCLYEGLYILDASLSEEALKKALERITSSIEGRGGVIHKLSDQGRKKFAYEVSKHRQGIYVFVYFSVVASAILELWKEYQLNENLIRYMMMRTDRIPEEVVLRPLVKREVRR